MNSETGLGGGGSTRPFTVSHSATVIVRQRQRLAHGHLKASITGRGLAARLIAAHANVDASAARGASLGSGFDITHDDGPWAMTSFCRRRPTSLPSDVVMGELSTLCSSKNRAISVIGANGRNVLGPGLITCSMS